MTTLLVALAVRVASTMTARSTDQEGGRSRPTASGGTGWLVVEPATPYAVVGL